MKMRRLTLTLVLLLLSTVAFAQSAAQKSFEQLKALAGSVGRHVRRPADACYAARDLEGQRAHA